MSTRVAVVGAGQFGQNHIRVLKQSAETLDCELAAIVDSDAARANGAASEAGCPAFTDYRDLVGKVDAAIVAVPTVAHAEVGCHLLDAGIDVLVEKPIAPDLASSQRLVDAAAKGKRILQVGHLERYNPAILALENAITKPLFFEIHRLSVFTPRSLDVDVVLDLMIHDIDIVLSLTGAEPEEIRAAGVSILSSKVDIANVRLQFAGGCVANLTASRVSTERVRKLRLFQPHEYISLDYTKRQAVRYQVGEKQKIDFGFLSISGNEPLQLQFEAFLKSVRTRETPKLSGEVAHRTLRVALAIVDTIEVHAELVARSLQSP